MTSQEGGKLRRHPVRRLLQMLIQRLAKGVIVEQRFPKPLPGDVHPYRYR